MAILPEIEIIAVFLLIAFAIAVVQTRTTVRDSERALILRTLEAVG